MIDRPPEKEQVHIVVRNLQPHLHCRLCTTYLPTFEQLKDTGLMVEDAIRDGILRDDYRKGGGGASSSGAKKEEVNATGSGRNRNFSNLGVPLPKVFKRLKDEGRLKPLAPRPPPNPLPPNYDENKYYIASLTR